MPSHIPLGAASGWPAHPEESFSWVRLRPATDLGWRSPQGMVLLAGLFWPPFSPTAHLIPRLSMETRT